MKIIKNYDKAFAFLRESKNFIYFSVIFFFVIALIGFLFPVFFREGVINFIRDLTSQIGDGLFEIIGFIIYNNAKASLFAIILGVGFGIFPMISLIVNGYVLGFVARLSTDQQGIFVLWRLLPHGIFELPAVLISIGIGLRLGTELIINRKKFGDKFFGAMRVFLLIILPLLIIAGIIEGCLIYFLK
jgi:stage II sporulation protein M